MIRSNTVQGESRPGSSPWRSVLSYIRSIIWPHRYRLAAGLALTIVNRAAGLFLPASTRFLIDYVIKQRDLHALGQLAILLTAATLVQGFTSFMFMRLMETAGEHVIGDLRCRVQAHIIRLPVAFYDGESTGQLISRVMSDVEDIRAFISVGLLDFVAAMVTTLIAVTVLLHISVEMSVISLLAICGYTILFRRALSALQPLYMRQAELNAKLTSRLAEALDGIRIVKAYRAESREEAAFSAGVREMLGNVSRIVKSNSLIFFSGTLLAGLGSALIVCIGVLKIFNGSLTLGELMTFTAFVAILVAPLNRLAALGRQLTGTMTGIYRTQELLGLRQESDASSPSYKPEGRLRGDIVFEKVGFAYKKGHPVLHEVSFRAKAGTATALIGPSGSGKSTIIRLLTSFYSPTSGRILVDDIDLQRMSTQHYRSHLGVVLQETFLFDGTIYDNVAFARPDATEQEVMRACKIAGVDRVAQRCEGGYQTKVGERGVKLSGGEKQCIAIARAIVVDPTILLLDEPTSSLDMESEAYVQQGLEFLLHSRTTFVVAHRLSTITSVDQVLVVEHGRIVRSGTPASLDLLHPQYDCYVAGGQPISRAAGHR